MQPGPKKSLPEYIHPPSYASSMVPIQDPKPHAIRQFPVVPLLLVMISTSRVQEKQRLITPQMQSARQTSPNDGVGMLQKRCYARESLRCKFINLGMASRRWCDDMLTKTTKFQTRLATAIYAVKGC